MMASVGKEQTGVSPECGGMVAGRGFVEIRILWHSAWLPISRINSDRICGIRVKINGDDNSLFSIVGVYLPCIDQGVDCYREHPVELYRVCGE